MNEVMPKVGDVATGTVVKVFSSYAILLFEEGWTGLLHISELSSKFIRSFTSYVTVGTIYSVKVIAIDDNGGVRVSLKQMTVADKRRAFRHRRIPSSEVNFQALEENLPEWIKNSNNLGENHD